jgi:xanthine dehydrogenase molybdenum-binding subunit
MVVECKFKSTTIHQGYVEPHNAIAHWNESGRVDIWTSTQGTFGVRRQTAGLLGLNESLITVYPVEIGGGFGGKTVVYLPPVAALLSRKAGRPVRIVMDRKSVFESTGPAPGGEITVKIGVGTELEMLAATALIRLEAGAYPGWVAETASKSVFSCYDVANTRVDGYDILVNKPKSNAYRAPGVPQVTFAVESAIDEICEAMGWDPLEFRLANASKEGTRRVDGPRLLKIGVHETLAAAQATDHWKSPLLQGENGSLRGRGVACSFALFSGRASTVTLHLNGDGTVLLVEGSADINGTRTALAMQVAEFLGISVEDIITTIGHTDAIGFDEIGDGNRTTYATGWAAHEAAKTLIDMMRVHVARLWGVDQSQVQNERGYFYSSGPGETSIGFKEPEIRLMASGEPISRIWSVDPPSPAQGVCACHIVDVEVDPAIGKVEILRYTAVQDVGRAIHRAQVEGQIQDATAQGICWALSEEYLFDAGGAMKNHTFQDYRIQTSADIPFIDPVIVEVVNPEHPFGVRGARNLDRPSYGGHRQCDLRRHRCADGRVTHEARECSCRAPGHTPGRVDIHGFKGFSSIALALRWKSRAFSAGSGGRVEPVFPVIGGR